MGKGSFQKEDEDIRGFAGDALCRLQKTEKMGLRGQEWVRLGWISG